MVPTTKIMNKQRIHIWKPIKWINKTKNKTEKKTWGVDLELAASTVGERDVILAGSRVLQKGVDLQPAADLRPNACQCGQQTEMPNFGSDFASIQTREYKLCRTLTPSNKSYWSSVVSGPTGRRSRVQTLWCATFWCFFEFFNPIQHGAITRVFFFEFFSSNPTWGYN